MINRNSVIASIVLTGLYAIVPSAGAATLEESGVEHEISSCIAEVRERLDYAGATRVRHDIHAIERRTVGYTLEISTALYRDNEEQPIRAYAASCIVNGDNPPLSFVMEKGW